MRQIGGLYMAAAVKPDLLQHTPRWSGTRRIGARVAPETEAVPRLRLHSERDVLERAEFGVNTGDLERACEATARSLRRGQRRHVLAGESDHPAIGEDRTGELPNEGSLAGAVGAYHRMGFALAHI